MTQSQEDVATRVVLARFADSMRCPREFLDPVVSRFLGDVDGEQRSVEAVEVLRRVRASLECGQLAQVVQDMDSAVDAMRLERYALAERQVQEVSRARWLVRNVYYGLRPLFPVSFRKYLQRIALRKWRSIQFPEWPVDTSVEQMFDASWAAVLEANDARELPFVWFWPDGKLAAAFVSHDVETAAGLHYCGSMMELEAKYQVQSAFEVVPEERYEVPEEFLEEIRDRGCEVCIHGLNHDGRLFTTEEIFQSRASRINDYARRWGARGFRSPVMYRNLDWLGALQFDYDMSVPNVAHLDPQRGGCCTILPYLIGDIVELPLTTIQDYSLFHILQQRSIDLWRDQLETIVARHGMASFIIHPDYVMDAWASRIHEELLSMLAMHRDERGLWLARPGEVERWWRARSRMWVEQCDGRWVVRGDQADRATVGMVALHDGQVRYRREDVSKIPAATPGWGKLNCP